MDPNLVPGFTAKFGPRNKPGLTQAEMAVLTGVAESWYRRLEAGGVPNPKTVWLERIVRILDLNEAKRYTCSCTQRGKSRRPSTARPQSSTLDNRSNSGTALACLHI